ASSWLDVTQEDVDEYSHATGDADWLHNDPERARREGYFGGTIVPGFMQLALCTALMADIGLPEMEGLDLGQTLNYGLDRVRFVRPLMVGARVRMVASLAAVDPKKGRLLLTTEVTLESDDGQGPVLVARWLFLVPEVRDIP
ncbi:MAG: MaoC family dehydratase N-terminal domain-containing protein, partial [Actinobacteria bacterium]|nr:MaoC family dehydratase N-terminal domain-containing protein [Actinomycetota bacterium]